MKSPLVRVLLSAALFVALPSLGSVVVAHTIEEMTRAVPVVVRARVGQVQASWDEGQRRIWTRAELQVLESVKGAPAATLVVRQPGGEVENIGQRVAGTAKFTPGEEAIFFLEPVPDEAGVFTTFALAAGKVSLEKTPTGEVRAVRHLDGLVFAPLAKQVVRPVVEYEDLGAPEAFLTRVKKAAGGAR